MPDFDLAQAGSVATLSLAAPERHNALSRETIATLADTLSFLDADPEIRCVVLTAQGKSFCAGADLGSVEDQDWTRNPLTDLCDRLEGLRPLTVCAMQGGVYGGGVELALSCDFRIGVGGMKMFVPPAELGIHYPSKGLQRAERLLGLQLARRIFLLAERFDAQALAEIGFLDHLVAPEDLPGAVDRMTGHICSLAPLAVQGMKKSLAEITRSPPDFTSATDRIAACFASEDHREALRARKEKRVPTFRGK